MSRTPKSPTNACGHLQALVNISMTLVREKPQVSYNSYVATTTKLEEQLLYIELIYLVLFYYN